MAVIEIKVPSIAESITEVTLSQWLKEDGAIVKRDEPICEFESDKATLELPAEVAGQLKHVATEGSDLKIGSSRFTIAPSSLSHCESVTSVIDSAILGTFISITAILYLILFNYR